MTILSRITSSASAIRTRINTAAAALTGAFDPTALFSPGSPIVPVSDERTRTWDFPVGYNLVYTPRSYEPVSFAQLRALADNEPLTRTVIETRKDQIEQLSWSIKSRDENNPAADAPGRIATMRKLWERPDGRQPFGSWLRELLEDLLVIDAPALEVRRTRGGQILGLDIINGATIKVLIDDTGRWPQPPAPAYEQVIHGRPWRLLTADDLIYAPRNRRPHGAYGFGPVEQILTTINIAIRREHMQLQHFSEGNVPPGMVSAPESWNVEQIRQFQEWFDSVLAGNTAERTKLIWGPAGTKYQAFKEAPYKDDFDEWLARIICFAFSISPNAFIKQVQRTTADTLQEAALKEGLEPLKKWVKHLVDGVIQNRAGHIDLEFAWDEEEALDPQSEATRLIGLINAGMMARNEARGSLGLDPIDGGDVVTITSAGGSIVPVATLPALVAAPPQPSEDQQAADAERDKPENEPPPETRDEDEPKPEGAADKAALPFRGEGGGSGHGRGRGHAGGTATARAGAPASDRSGGGCAVGAAAAVLSRASADCGAPHHRSAGHASAAAGPVYP